ncbi:hypothetical protein TDB9533_01787 [Thalassocella blandensis]|nr:hypothetical protein TDB9533_01787 [Thalassocella blandensis]
MSIQHIALHAAAHLRMTSRTARRAMLSFLVTIVGIFTSVSVLPAYADLDRNSSQLRRDEQRNYKNDAGSAAAKAQAQHGGKVLNVSKSTVNGRTVYRVKLLLDSGRIKIVTIPE